MNKKLLIIGDDILIFQSLKGACESLGFSEVTRCDHSVSSAEFLKEKATHVIVTDYNRASIDSLNIWGRIGGIYGKNQIIVRCGYREHNLPDYFKLPFSLPELKRILRL